MPCLLFPPPPAPPPAMAMPPGQGSWWSHCTPGQVRTVPDSWGPCSTRPPGCLSAGSHTAGQQGSTLSTHQVTHYQGHPLQLQLGTVALGGLRHHALVTRCQASRTGVTLRSQFTLGTHFMALGHITKGCDSAGTTGRLGRDGAWGLP